MSKNALDVWGLDKESALHKFFVGEPMGVIAASPDGAHFAAGSLTGAAYIWEVSTGRLVRTWPAHFKAISAMTFAAEGSVLVTAGEDTVVSAWSLSSLLDPAAGGASGGVPTPLHSWAEHALPVTSLACGNGGGGGACLVASASSDRTCKLWTLGGGHLLRTVALPAALCSVALDACEATLYAGAADGRVFEVPLNAAPSAAMDGAAAAVLEGHTRAVSAIACTADGERVVTASEDGTCRVFDAASRQTTHVLRHPKSAPFTAIVAAPKWRIAGDGAGAGAGGAAAGGERRRLAPLAPFSRFAGASDAKGGGKGGKLAPWEGAPIVLRGVGGASDGDASGSGSGRGSIPGSGSVSVSDPGSAPVAGAKKQPRPEDGSAGDADAARGSDVAELERKLAAAEAETARVKEEAANWKRKHGELRAFVAEELAARESARR